MAFRGQSSSDIGQRISTIASQHVYRHYWAHSIQTYAPNTGPKFAEKGRVINPDPRDFQRLKFEDDRNSRVSGEAHDFRLKRDFVAAFQNNDLNARARIAEFCEPDSDIVLICNCLEFVYLIFFAGKILNVKDLERIPFQPIQYTDHIMSIAMRHVHQFKYSDVGDIAIFFINGEWNHIGILKRIASTEEDSVVISLEQDFERTTRAVHTDMVSELTRHQRRVYWIKPDVFLNIVTENFLI